MIQVSIYSGINARSMRLDGLPVLVPVPCFFRLGLIRYFAFFFFSFLAIEGLMGLMWAWNWDGTGRGILEPGEAGRMGWKEDPRGGGGWVGLGLTRALHTLPGLPSRRRGESRAGY
jgi:hypothetical protein